MMLHLSGIFFFFPDGDFFFLFIEQITVGRRSDPDTQQMVADQFQDKVIIFCFLQMSEKCILSQHVRPQTASPKAFTHQVCDESTTRKNANCLDAKRPDQSSSQEQQINEFSIKM